MPKILYDHQTFGLQKYGGISRYFYEISKRIDQLPDFNVEILAPLHFNEYLRTDNHLVKGVYLPHIPKTLKICREVNILLSRYALNDYQPDLIHETYYQEKSFVTTKIPVVTTVYDMIHEKFRDNFSTRDKTSKVKKKAIDRANHVLCISENTRKDLIEIFSIPEEKISVIYLGFSFNDDNSSVSPLFERPYILYVGNRDKYKNFERLLNAFASSPALIQNFLLVAFGGGVFKSKERQSIQELGLNENNIAHIQGSDEILKNLYKNATAFIYPSLYEGFGIPPLEAMSLNCPVICSNISSIPEVVGNAGEYFDPYEIDGIRLAMEKVVESQSLRQDLIARGQKQLIKFSWNLCAKQTADVYRKVLS